MDQLLVLLLTISNILTNRIESFTNQKERLSPLAPILEVIEQEFQDLLKQDDLIVSEIEKLLDEYRIRRSQGLSTTELTLKIEELIGKMDQSYKQFIEKNPKHIYARLAYASFLEETGDPQKALNQLQIAIEISPSNPAVWNNIGVYYAHHGEIKEAFKALEKARALAPLEPVYDRNLASVVSTYRKDALEYYHLKDDVEVLEKAISLYKEALRKAPPNFLWQSELAQVYYFLPKNGEDLRIRQMEQEAIEQWQRALELATSEEARQGVLIHLARWYLRTGNYDLAKSTLQKVTLLSLQSLRSNLEKRLSEAGE